jgi:hypothetical protein
VRLTRLAQMDVHVDEARRDDRVGRVDHPRAIGLDLLADLHDEPVLDQHVTLRIQTQHRIDQPAALDQRLHAGTGTPFTSASRTAMRTKTPLWTWAT